MKIDSKFFIKNIKTTKKDDDELFLISSKLALSGNINAMKCLASMYREGRGTYYNIDLSIKWEEKVFESVPSDAHDLVDTLLCKKDHESVKKAIEICEKFIDQIWASDLLSKAYYNGIIKKQDEKKSLKLLLKQPKNSGLYNGIKPAKLVNKKILDFEKIALIGNYDEIRSLWCILAQYNIKNDYWISDYCDTELCDMYGEKITLDKINNHCAVISIDAISIAYDFNYALNVEQYENGSYPLLIDNPEIDKIDSEPKQSIRKNNVDNPKIKYILDKKDECNNIDFDKININFINTINYNIKLKILYYWHKIQSINLNDLEIEYAVGKCIYGKLSENRYYSITSDNGMGMGDQFRILSRRELTNYDNRTVIVNERASSLPELFGIDGLIMSDLDRRSLMIYGSISMKKMNVGSPGWRSLYPGISHNLIMDFVFGAPRIFKNRDMDSSFDCEMFAPMVNIRSFDRIPPHSILVNPFGNYIQTYGNEIRNCLKITFDKIISYLIEKGNTVYINNPPKGSLIPKGTIAYNATIKEFVEDSCRFDLILSTYTGFMEVAMHTPSSLIALIPRGESRKNYARICSKYNYNEIELNQNPKTNIETLKKIIDVELSKEKPPSRFINTLNCPNIRRFDCTDEKLRLVPNLIVSKASMKYIRASAIGLDKILEEAMKHYDKFSDPLSAATSLSIMTNVGTKGTTVDDILDMHDKSVKQYPWTTDYTFDIISKMNNPSNNKILYRLASSSSRSESMIRLGECYYKGIGTEVDIRKAAEIFEKTLSGKSIEDEYENIRLKFDLYDALFKINTDEASIRMIEVIKPLVEKKLPGAIGRMGFAYREGKGVSKNIEKSYEFFEIASKMNVGWANAERRALVNMYFDELWKRNNPNDDVRMIEIIVPEARTGNAESIARLALAYRYGRGLTKDVPQASKLFKKATELGVNWAKNYV